jgi:hypothetical protein
MGKLLLFSLALCLFSCSSNRADAPLQNEAGPQRKTAEYETMEDFSKAVFTLITRDQYPQLAELVPELSEYQQIVNNSSWAMEKKEQKSKELESIARNKIESLKRTYTRFKEETEKAGIDWSKAAFDHIDFEHSKKDNIEKADISINFKYKGVNYRIELKECYKFKDTWLLGEQINFQEEIPSRYGH